MDREELKEVLLRKRKGKAVSVEEQAGIIDIALEIGKDILDRERDNALDRAIIADLKMYFPLLHREIRRIFLNQPKPKDNEI